MLTREQILFAFSPGFSPEKEKIYEEFTLALDNLNISEEERDQLHSWYEEAVAPQKEPETPVDKEMLQQIKARARRAPVEPPDSATAKNRLRAMRGNMLKKLKKVFSPYTLFTAEQAATLTKTNIYDMTSYLTKEARLAGTQVQYDEREDMFYIMSMF